MSSGPTVQIDTASSRRSGRSVLEFVAVLMLGVATVATAWCGYQSSRWNGVETDESRVAAFASIESSRLFSLATEKIAYDGNITSQYARAVADRDEELQAFIIANLVRTEFLPVLQEWESQWAAGDSSPDNLFEDQEYLDAQFAASREVNESVAAAQDRAASAGARGDDYLVMTLLTATALFFAGVTSSFSRRTSQLSLLCLTGALLVFVAVRLIDLPVA